MRRVYSNHLLSVPVEELGKSVNIWWKYGQKSALFKSWSI